MVRRKTERHQTNKQCSCSTGRFNISARQPYRGLDLRSMSLNKTSRAFCNSMDTWSSFKFFETRNERNLLSHPLLAGGEDRLCLLITSVKYKSPGKGKLITRSNLDGEYWAEGDWRMEELSDRQTVTTKRIANLNRINLMFFISSWLLITLILLFQWNKDASNGNTGDD